MVGWGSKKSRKPCVVAESKAPVNSRRPSPTSVPSAKSRKTKLKCLVSFALCNAVNNVTGRGKWQRPRAITSSENTVDVIVEKRPDAAVKWFQSVIRTSHCRDRRTLSGDRLRSSARRQLQIAGEPTQNYSHSESSLKPPNRKVSRVSAHAFKRMGAQPALMRGSI